MRDEEAILSLARSLARKNERARIVALLESRRKELWNKGRDDQAAALDFAIDLVESTPCPMVTRGDMDTSSQNAANATGTCRHHFESNPGMWDTSLRYCAKCGIVEDAVSVSEQEES